MNIINESISINGFKATLTGYILDTYKEVDENALRPAILICPGGGYVFCSDREAESIAVRFAGKGYQCFVLRYSCSPDGAEYPVALAQAMGSMKYIRENAERFKIDPHKVFVLGFSAGGHLAADLSCEFDNEEALRLAGAEVVQVRPDASVLCYPVITSGEKAHRGSFENLLGRQYSDEMLARTSLENRVTPNTPPTFIWHTFEDGTVPVENSLYYAASLRANRVVCEMHIFPHGGHGLSLANTETGKKGTGLIVDKVQCWPEMADDFLKNI